MNESDVMDLETGQIRPASAFLTDYARRIAEALEALVIVQAERITARGAQRNELVMDMLRKVATSAGYGSRLVPEQEEQDHE